MSTVWEAYDGMSPQEKLEFQEEVIADFFMALPHEGMKAYILREWRDILSPLDLIELGLSQLNKSSPADWYDLESLLERSGWDRPPKTRKS